MVREFLYSNKKKEFKKTKIVPIDKYLKMKYKTSTKLNVYKNECLRKRMIMDILDTFDLM